MAGILWLQNRCVEVIDIESFDYHKFLKDKGDYLIAEYGQEVGQAQIAHSDLNQELAFTKNFLQKVKIQKKAPAVQDIQDLLNKGFVLICLINSKSLNRQHGYVGHFVVVKGFDRTGLYLHDPGLPPYQNKKVTYRLFEKAWAYPNVKAKNIMAFRLISKDDSTFFKIA